jgi:hypothetical protein
MDGSYLEHASPFDRLVRDPALRSAIGYWDSLRGPALVPSRMALDPGQMRPHLQNAAILEVPKPGSVRIRLAGARINALIGMETRGMPLRSLFDLADRARISSAVEEALSEPAVLIVDAMAPAPRFAARREEEVRAQIAIMPMSDTDLAITRALYVMGDVDAAHGQSGDQYRWSVLGLDTIPLQQDRSVVRADRTRTLSSAPVQAPSEADRPDPEHRGAFARARFRVIQGGLA